MRLQPLPAFADNYIWALENADDPATSGAIIVDPGQAAPVLAAAAQGLRPTVVLLTHHHPDHIGGAAELLRHWPRLPMFAPDDARIDLPCQRVGDGDTVRHGDWRFEVLAVPGHTVSHIAFSGHGHLFCGDTLFSLGCGRLFEGTPAQMLESLDRLAALPGDTLVCCGHEYTLANAAFAGMVEPDNPALRRRTEDATAMRQDGRATLPSTIADERAANPFLRVDEAAVRAAVATRLGRGPLDRVDTFAALRRWKDGFRA
ncbi:hydroxyacylglutathione hydrolase [Luteimonas sp. 50]|uniref:Hydroxyacylglutathione hydrolase n=1 Tax=Cognatiluteimonas sedimenti TaxID=2927791 RepID=A0ABT0A555_9GAMM|nr:hydroxyacylglutathione hydrolase [Lysobacter sedimenti]MCJ0826109.1 hydroxyacylglutathione hydrolase [Lysobacter sedimenti]